MSRVLWQGAPATTQFPLRPVPVGREHAGARIAFGAGHDSFLPADGASKSSNKGWKERFNESLSQKAFRFTSGLTLSIPALDKALAHWSEVAKAAVAELDAKSLDERFPAIPQKLKTLGLEGQTGIPPLVRAVDDQGKPTGPRTNGIVTDVGTHILQGLPLARTAEDAVGQLWGTFRAVYDKAAEKGKAIQRPDLEASTMAEKGMKIVPLDGQLFTSIHADSLVFIAPNGAIQFLKPPNAETLVAMIEADPVAQQALKKRSPLKRLRLFPMIEIGPRIPYDIVIAALQKGEINRHKTGWSNIHTILRAIPFDYPRHIAEGRLKVQLDKPGHDGKTVWESLQANQNS